MKFIESELICLNSILDGKSIVGIEIKENENMLKDEYIDEAIIALKGKNIIDSNGKLTKKGIIPIKALEEYKNSERHISINELKIALLDAQNVIGIDCRENIYDISVFHKLSIINSILEKSEFMRKASKMDKKYKSEGVPIEELLLKKDNFEKEYIRITEYYLGSIVKDNIYYWDKETGFQYSLISKRRLQLEPNTMRKKLLNLLDIN